MTQPLVAIRDVRLRFGGVTALDGASLDIPRGQIVGLIGPNGAGKTSLFNCLSRLYEPQSGSIVLDGHDLLQARPHEVVGLGLTRTFQRVALFGRLSVLDNILIGDHHRTAVGLFGAAVGWPSARRAERAAIARARLVLDELDLGSVATRPAGALPFAQQKRVELARALVSEPRLLLLDEPAGGLAHAEIDAMRELIERLQRERALTVLVVEHHMELVMSLSHQVTVLDYGRTIASGPPAVIRADPRVIEAYLGPPRGVAA